MRVLRDRIVQYAVVSGLILAGCTVFNPALYWLALLWMIAGGAAVGQAREQPAAVAERRTAPPTAAEPNPPGFWPP